MAAAEETPPGAAPSVPVVLFAHSRPEHLRQVLASLR